MNSLKNLFWALTFLSPWFTWAQGGDDPLPYESTVEEAAPSRQEKRREAPRPGSMAYADDNNLGLSLEGLAGLWLQDSPQGNSIDSLFASGARLGWELGRAFSSEENARKSFWVDLTWLTALRRGGTEFVTVQSQLHYVSLAPAYALNLRGDRELELLLQLGGGIAISQNTLAVDNEANQIVGIKPLLQYGMALRSTSKLTDSGSLKLSIRLEATRFRRGYMDDTLFGASLGLLF